MNIFALSGVLIVISCGFLAWIVFRGGKKLMHRIATLFNLTAVIWGIGAYAITKILDQNTALLTWKFIYIGIIFIPVLFYHFVHTFLKLKNKIILCAVYAFGSLFVIIEWTPWADLFFGIKNISLLFSSLYWVYPPTLLFIIFLIGWFGIATYSNYKLLRAYLKSASTKKRLQIKYLFLGTTIGFIGGGSAFLPCFGINLYPILSFAILAYPLLTTYAIIRFQLMDVRLVMKRGSIYILTALFIYGCFYLVTWMQNSFLGGGYTRAAFIVGGFMAIVFVILLQFYEKLIRWFANKYFFAGLYIRHEVIRKLSRKITTVVGLNKLTKLVLETMMTNMQCDKSGIILKRNNHYEAIAQNGINIKAFKDNPATKFLEKHQKGITYEEFEMRDLGHLQKYFKNWDIELFLPVINRQKLYGMILLGTKLNRDAYTKDDIDLLQDVANQSGVAFENAEIYNKIEQKVKEQTKAIQELLNTKNEFLNIASHQLRGPVSAIKGMISMLIEGGMEPSAEKDFIKKSYQSVNRLAVIINDILDAQSFAGSSPKEIKLNLKPVNIETLIAEVIEMYQEKADKKKLYLKFEQLKKPVPKITVDSDRIRGAIENLIGNALKYTPEGGITVKLKIKKSKLEVRVQDTGIGLTKDDKKILFKKFSRGRGGKKVNVDSSGLGLYITKNIALAHSGDLFAESEGKNKGSTFVLSLNR